MGPAAFKRKVSVLAVFMIALWFLMSNAALLVFGTVVEGEVTKVVYRPGAGATSTSVYYKINVDGSEFEDYGYFSTMIGFTKGGKIDVLVLKTYPAVHYLDYPFCIFLYCVIPFFVIIGCVFVYSDLSRRHIKVVSPPGERHAEKLDFASGPGVQDEISVNGVTPKKKKRRGKKRLL